jgi:ribose transport system permease protein
LAKQGWGHISALYVVALLLAGVVAVVVYRTRAGRTVGLTGANPVAARMLGIRVHVVYVLTFAGAGALYGLAGSLTAGFVQAPDATLGVTYQLTTLTAVAIAGAVFGGGPASIGSLVAAATLLPLIDQTLALGDLASGWRVVIQGMLLVLAVAASTLTVLGRAGLHRLTSARQPRRGL